MKYYISTSATRQARTLHRDKDCIYLAVKANGTIEIDPATLRVFVRCKYCFK